MNLEHHGHVDPRKWVGKDLPRFGGGALSAGYVAKPAVEVATAWDAGVGKWVYSNYPTPYNQRNIVELVYEVGDKKLNKAAVVPVKYSRWNYHSNSNPPYYSFNQGTFFVTREAWDAATERGVAPTLYSSAFNAGVAAGVSTLVCEGCLWNFGEDEFLLGEVTETEYVEEDTVATNIT